ncbi:ester cyclase [Actinoplanes sp. M2I2]|uniref:ester cyclase n=1 Tax=Actinoplanes sp. M2I2 TaxID=1734444 RepID=UPI0020202BFD|nr:ester cyclase [Actinoplanes sp. M2I2]
MNSTVDRTDIVDALIRVGQQGIAGGDETVLDEYFGPGFVFHGPDGDADLAGLKTFWAAMRAAFSDFAVTRGHMVVEGQWVGAQTRMSGHFDQEFTASPVGVLPPTGRPFALDLLNIFRFDDDGKLVEEWCLYDVRGMLAQLQPAPQTDIPALYQGYIDALNERRVGTLSKYVHDPVIVNSTPTPLADYIAVIESNIDAVPDFHWGIENLQIQDDVIAVRFTDTGTAVKTWFGIEPTGRPFRMPEMAFYHVRDGKIGSVEFLLDLDAVRAA